MKYATATPFIASYVVLRKGKTVACVLRAHTKWMNGYYGLPSGKVEQNESFVAAAIREAKEEVGVTVAPEDLKHVLTAHRNDAESDASFWVDVIFEATKWQSEPYNAEPHMHDELAWLDPDNLPANMIKSVRFYLEQIQAGKSYAEYGWNKPKSV